MKLGSRPLRVWGVASQAYFVATFQRATLAVSSLQAVRRFGLQHWELSALLVMQLVIYAGMQIPVGVALGRFGPRRLLVTGSLLMALSQVVFALTGQAAIGILARMLLGAGDAMTFISVLRVVEQWLPARQNPLFVQLTGLVGLLGSLISSLPLLFALQVLGWTATFLVAGGLSALSCVAVFIGLPVGSEITERARAPELWEAVFRDLNRAWRSRGTRLGVWTTFTAGFPSMVFSLLWGYPLLVQGEHYSKTVAATLLTLLTFTAMALGPVFGHIIAMRPWLRSRIIYGTVGANAVSWGAVLLWPGRAPLLLLFVLILVMGANSPASLIGFDYVRTWNPKELWSLGYGIVNVGAFVTAVGVTLAIGLLLDLKSSSGQVGGSLTSFKLAFAVQFVVWIVGLSGLRRAQRRGSHSMGDAGGRPAEGVTRPGCS